MDGTIAVVIVHFFFLKNPAYIHTSSPLKRLSTETRLQTNKTKKPKSTKQKKSKQEGRISVTSELEKLSFHQLLEE